MCVYFWFEFLKASARSQLIYVCQRIINPLIYMAHSGRAPKRQRVGEDALHYPGGYLQQVAAYDREQKGSGDVSVSSIAGASSTDPPYESKLARHLVTMVMWSFMSACVAQKLANLAMQDGAKGVGLDSVSSVGTKGVNKQNSFRDLLMKLKPLKVVSCLKLIKMPIFATDFVKVVQETTHMLYPHALLAALYEHHPREFTKRLCGGAISNIGKFWESQVRHPLFDAHPMHECTKYPFRKFGIPIRLHGDGVTSIACGKIWAKSVEAWSWSSCLVQPGVASWVGCFIIMMVFEQLIAAEGRGEDTMEALWKELDWSLYWAYIGEWPDRDANNVLYTAGLAFRRRLTPLAGGFRLILWVLRADLDWLCKRLRLASFRACQCICCLASPSPALPWTDCRDNALWLETIWTEDAWRRAFPNRHRLFRHVPGAGVGLYVPDYLHTKLIGTDCYYMASVMHLLIYYIMSGSVLENLAELVKNIRSEYSKRGVWHDRITTIKLTTLQSDGAKLPYLKATGKEVKALGPILLYIFSKYIRTASYFAVVSEEVKIEVARGLQLSITINNLIHKHTGEYALPTDTGKKVRNCCFEFNQTVTWLIGKLHPRVQAFHYTIKSHYLLHMGLASEYINPELAACDQGEDLMKVVKRFISMCTRASPGHVAARTAMTRYVHALGLDLLNGSDPNARCWKV